MKKKKPTYEELESRLTQAEEAIRAIRSGEIDVIVGEKCPFIIKAKEMAEALKDSEERYRTLVENSIVGILIVVGPPPKIVFANIPFAKKMGYAVDELLAMTPYEIYELVHPDDREKFFERFADRITGKVPPSQYEVRGIRKDKRLIWGEVYSTLIKYQGKDALQVSFIDITERKLAEESLRLSEERFRQFFENAPVYCYMVSPEGIILNVNNAIISVLGYEKEELIGKPFTTIYAPEYHSKAMKNLETWRTTRRLDEVEMEIISKKGERRLGILSADVVIDKDGKVIHSISILRDITEHKKAVDRLKESEERYRTAIENSNDGVSMVKDGFHLYVNKKFLDIFGYTNADEIIGRSISITIHPDDRDRVMEISLKRQRGEDVPSRYEFKGIKKDGEVVHIEVSVARTTYCGETVSLAYLRDISERKKREEEIALLQEQLRQAQKMEAIGRLAGGVAHDFNNILSVIKGTAQLLLLDLREGDPLYTNLKEIEKASDRAADLTRQLLAFSRKQVMEMRVLDLNTVVRNLEKMLRRIIGEDIELVTYLSEGLWRVKVDPSQIEQVIINIVVNARDAMPDGGKLTIETANVELDEAYAKKHIAVTPGPYVMLSISDTGVGMTKEVQEKIFDPFFTTKEMGRGTGLGLSTVYGIVKQSGGNIWVYSEPGRGSTFKIYLPRVEGALEGRKEEVSKEVPTGSETVLVVEDEEVVRKLAVRLLKRQGYRVLEASDGGQAFILCEKYRDSIHLILTDVVMPGISGRELAERLKLIHPEARVLYMSGYTDNVILHHGILEEGIAFIQKPFILEVLARKVREVLDK